MQPNQAWRCEGCGLDLSLQEMCRNGWQDLVCPNCGSQRFVRNQSRLERLRAFLIEWNKV
jgi:predicted RNA-binding Zn-ribbon protein involved in translation (DUF1610 family)